MHSYFHRALQKQARKLRSGEGGFTLIELLITITLVAVLTGVVLLSLNGFQDTGEIAATDQEADAMNAAQAAFCARFSRYGTDAELLGATTAINTTGTKFLAKAPTKNTSDVTGVSGSQGKCPGSNFGQAQSSYSIHAPVAPADYSAVGAELKVTQGANVDNPFGRDSGTPLVGAWHDGVTAGSQGGAHAYVGLLASDDIFNTSVTSGPHSDALNNGSATSDVFFSADEANVNKIVPKNQGGTCDTSANLCPGIASSKRHYTTGKLIALSCSAGGGQTLLNGNACPAPTPALATPPRSAAAVVGILETAGNASVVSFADPGGRTGPDPDPEINEYNNAVNPTSPPTAPYGVAALQALAAAGMDANEYNTWRGNNTISFATGQSVTTTLAGLTAGTFDIILGPYSFAYRSRQIAGLASGTECTLQDDAALTHCERNPWGLITAGYSPIKQFVVVVRGNPDPDLKREGLARKYIDYVVQSDAGRKLMTGFGYSIPG